MRDGLIDYARGAPAGASDWVKRLQHPHARRPTRCACNLSGGNQQKVVLAQVADAPARAS